MIPGELWLFAGVMALGQFSPGPDMLLLTRTALRHGPSVGTKMALGISCGLTVHATIAIAGMAAVLERSAALRRVLLWAAALYLLWLAYGMLRQLLMIRKSGVEAEIRDGNTHRSPFIRGLLCNLLNPKVGIFLAAVCAPFLAGEHPAWWPAALWTIIVGLGALLWTLWVTLLQWPPLRRGYAGAAPLLDAAFGIALTVLAVALIFQG